MINHQYCLLDKYLTVENHYDCGDGGGNVRCCLQKFQFLNSPMTLKTIFPDT